MGDGKMSQRPDYQLTDEDDPNHEIRQSCLFQDICSAEILSKHNKQKPVSLDSGLEFLNENREVYGDVFRQLFEKLYQNLHGTDPLVNLWIELMGKITAVNKSYITFTENSTIDIWITIDDNTLEASLEIARSQSLMRKVFRNYNLDFLLIIEDESARFELPDGFMLIYRRR